MKFPYELPVEQIFIVILSYAKDLDSIYYTNSLFTQRFINYFKFFFNNWSNKLFGKKLCEGELIFRLRIIFFRLRIFEFCAQEPLLNSSSYRNFIITVRLSAGLNFMKQKEKFIQKNLYIPFFFVDLCFN